MSKTNFEKCSVLINSCDRYEEVWAPFFHFFKKHWKDCPYAVYLNTETKKYIDKDLSVVTLNDKNKKHTWSKRLILSLKKIKTKYVIIMLEDFFLVEDVKQSEIDKTIGWLDENKDVSCFQFYPNKQLLCENDDIFPGYSKRSLAGKWWLRCQASVWRKKDLLKYLNPYEDAWQFEEYGTGIAKLYNKRFYNCFDKDVCPFTYNVFFETGYGIHQGKWLKTNIELFRAEGINCDFSLGILEGEKRLPFICEPSKKILKEKWIFLLHGTGDPNAPYMSIKQQIKTLFSSPASAFKLLKIKLSFIFSPKYKKTR